MLIFEWLRESIWGYPIIAAIHVLALALVGATVFTRPEEFKTWKRIGLSIVLLSGLLIFGMHPAQYAASVSFRIKLLLLVAVLGLKLPRTAALALWVAIIFASRGIAFF
jgi:multidrug transporter EmrE-like cation transporter